MQSQIDANGAQLDALSERYNGAQYRFEQAQAAATEAQQQLDATTAEGKAPAEVARRCAAAGVPCIVFGGTVSAPLPGVETIALSGDPDAAADDLLELGLRLGTRLLDAAG